MTELVCPKCGTNHMIMKDGDRFYCWNCEIYFDEYRDESLYCPVCGSQVISTDIPGLHYCESCRKIKAKGELYD